MKFAKQLSAVAGLALVVGAAVASPQETFNPGTLVSNGPANNAANGVFNFTSTGGYSLAKIFYSGGITASNAGTFLTELRFQLTPPGGNPTILIQPFTTGGTWTGTRTVNSSVLVSPTYDPAGAWELRGYESFDDGGTASVDANWSSLQFIFDNEAIIAPTGTGTYTPNSGLVGTTTVAAVTVTPGTNPVASVTLDASGLGAGSVTLLDDGNAPDAAAGDNIWSANVNVASGSGLVTTPFTMLDTVNTSGSGSMGFTVTLPPPANDNCGTAIPASLGATAYNNSSATNDGLTVCVSSGKDIWYTYTTGANTNDLTFSTCTGTTQDTVLSVFDACGGTSLGCNDDGCATQSTVTITGVTADTTYYIRVASFGAAPAGGAGTLTISQFVPPTPPQWDETVNGGGDAGDLPGTAQVPTGTNPFNNIIGTFTDSDVDMYKIEICDPANFSATLVNATTGTQDTQLFLFDANGAGVQFNDDANGIGPSAFANQFVTTAGTYYIAITRYNRDPVNAAAALIWENAPFGTVRQPDGLLNGGDVVVTGWTGAFTSASQAYRLDMTGTCFASDVCAADYNADTEVDFFDYLDFVADFSANTGGADFNGDTEIDFFDYLDFVAAFSEGC